MATPQKVLNPRSAAEYRIAASFPTSTVTNTVRVTVSVADQPLPYFLRIVQLIADMRAPRVIVRSDAFNQLARDVVARRVIRDQENIDAWADALGKRIVEFEE